MEINNYFTCKTTSFINKNRGRYRIFNAFQLDLSTELQSWFMILGLQILDLLQMIWRHHQTVLLLTPFFVTSILMLVPEFLTILSSILSSYSFFKYLLTKNSNLGSSSWCCRSYEHGYYYSHIIIIANFLRYVNLSVWSKICSNAV